MNRRGQYCSALPREYWILCAGGKPFRNRCSVEKFPNQRDVIRVNWETPQWVVYPKRSEPRLASEPVPELQQQRPTAPLVTDSPQAQAARLEAAIQAAGPRYDPAWD